MANSSESKWGINKDANILITGSAGFMGRNLSATLRAEGFSNLLLYDISSPEGALSEYAHKADYVFHLAGINRPQSPDEFYTGNADLTTRLIAALKEVKSSAPLLLTSTAQAGNGSDYAKSKEAAEAAVFTHGKENQSPVLVYRLPGVFGKWSRPSYNTVVATFCHNVANGLPIEVRDPAFSFPLCYIDDVVKSFVTGMGEAAQTPQDFIPKENCYQTVSPVYDVTLGWLAGTIRSFAKTRENLGVPNMADECTKKLWATYLSFIPQGECGYSLTKKEDERGSFTEFLRTYEHGQVSVNVAKPGVVKGNHWHNTKNEKFLVVSGEGVIRIREVGGGAVNEYKVSGSDMRVVDIPPGSTHNIENTGQTDLVTVMWASEPFDAENPDTYFEKV